MRLYLLVGMAAVACAQQPGPNFYSVQKELALGKQLASEVTSRVSLNNPAVSAYVDRTVQRLTSQISNSPFPYVVTVLKDDARVAPEVLPGGFIYIPSGMFAAAASESDFAGLLARAMADVAQRTATRMRTHEELVQNAMQPLATMDGSQGNAIRRGMVQSIPQGMQVFQRQLRLAAEERAVQAMAAGGYDPAALVEYASRADKEDDRFLDSLQQTAASVTVAPGGDGAEFARVREMVGK